MRFINKLMAALREKKTFVAFLSCEVTYSGRAETFLGRGERVLSSCTGRTGQHRSTT